MTTPYIQCITDIRCSAFTETDEKPESLVIIQFQFVLRQSMERFGVVSDELVDGGKK
jgi:hypothetical protein